MQNNRHLVIYTATNRKEAVLHETPTDIQSFVSRLWQSQTLPVTHGEFMALPKSKQDDMKDVGAYIAGTLKDGRRKSGAVITRCAAVLDADNLGAGDTEELVRRVASLGICYCIHSTAKHAPHSPRLRVVVPFCEDISADQYAPVVRWLCQLIQPEMTWFDPSTDQAGRIMYYPAHCSDVQPVFYYEDKPLLDASSFLDKIGDWHDMTSWPRFPREAPLTKKAEKQGDPEAKSGIVGAFCRAYDVCGAMDAFLPGVYEPTDTEGRYTFVGGSTSGGAVIYDNGKFLFSHHATDPCSGQLVNAFDLVRLHRFGDLDNEARPGTPPVKMPSYAAMCELAKQDEAVKEQMALEVVRSSAFEDFKDIAVDEKNKKELAKCAGEILSLSVMRKAVTALGVQVRKNLITNRVEISGMPTKYSDEDAINILPTLLLDTLRKVGIKGVGQAAISDFLGALADEQRYNPVLDLLRSEPWDGVRRFHDLLDMIHVDAQSFYALLVRKWLIQCVAMAHNNTRYAVAADGVLTVQGAQGIGKTMLFRKLAVNPAWFAEGVSLDMRNKDDILRATSVWITELGELDSTLQREQASLKAFITQPTDRVRAPYAREETIRPRRMSPCGTINQDRFLKDSTGNRRFWVVPLTAIDLKKLTSLDRNWFVQLWREVYVWWQNDPQGFRLSPAERDHLEELNRNSQEYLPGEEEIRTAMNFDLPREQWGEFTAVSLKGRLFYGDSRITLQQIGRALAKLVREDKRLSFRENSRSRVRTYRLPIAQNLTALQ